METIILASSSPRRRKVMKQLHIPFETEVMDYEETFNHKISPKKEVKRLALDKMEHLLNI
jgi:septum formation protein